MGTLRSTRELHQLRVDAGKRKTGGVLLEIYGQSLWKTALYGRCRGL